MELIYWATAALALAGVVLNIRKNKFCFLLWGFTNATWTFADATHGLWPQAVLQAIYFLLSVYGLMSWWYPEPGNSRK